MELNELYNKIVNLLIIYLPKILIASAVLVTGWIAAIILTNLSISLLKRMQFHKGIATILDDKEKESINNFEITLKRLIFFFLILFVLIGFFHILDLDVLNQPINNFLETIFSYAPRLIVPLILFLVAWITAFTLRALIKKSAEKLKIDSLLHFKGSDPDQTRVLTVSTVCSETVYWLIFLLFIPAIFDALALDSLAKVLSTTVDKIFAFVPNLFASLIIFAAGWIVAKIVKNIIVNLCSSATFVEICERAGLGTILKPKNLATALGAVAYIVIIVPILIASLNALNLDPISSSAGHMLEIFFLKLPAIFSAILLLVVAFYVGRILAEIVENFLSNLGFNGLLSKMGFTVETNTKKLLPSQIGGTVTFLVLFVLAWIEAFNIVGLTSLGDILRKLTNFAATAVVGVAIIAIGMYVSNIIYKTISKSSTAHSNILANIAKLAILCLAIAMGLKHMGIGDEIVTLAFGLIVGSFSIALAIAFGIGGKDHAKEIIKEVRNKISPS